MSEIRNKRVLISLAVATALGIFLELAGLPKNASDLLGYRWAELPIIGRIDLWYTHLRYTLDSPAAFLTGLGCFFCGRYVSLLQKDGNLQNLKNFTSYGLVILAGVFAKGELLNKYIVKTFFDVYPLDAAYHGFHLIGSFEALMMAAFFGGLLLGKRGIILLLGVVAVFLVY